MRPKITWAFLLLLAGCQGRDSGFDSLMTIANAQFIRGPLPASSDGPAISAFSFNSQRVEPGLEGKGGGGNVARDTASIALMLQGDVGYWVIIPGAVDPQNLDTLTFSMKASFSPRLSLGMHTVIAQAANSAGRFGPQATANLMTDAVPPDMNTLSVTLTWDTEADLDLHLVIPDGTVLWAKNIADSSGGILDYDSNSNCQIDGRRKEVAYWTTPPPSGHYIARVDAYSLCGEAQANWTLVVDGAATGKATGWMRDRDTAYAHDANGGVTAIEFDVQ
jgi:hypothetical protein